MTKALDAEQSPARDRQDDRRVLLATAGALLLAFSIGAVLQTVFVFRPERLEASAFAGVLPELGTRLLANLITVALILLFCALIRPDELRRPLQVLTIATIAVGVSLIRFGIQLGLHIYTDPNWSTFFGEVGTVSAVGVIAVALALAQVSARKRLRDQERAHARQELRASAALAALTGEELRVRREVAEGLHGTVQNQLVLVEVQLDSIIERWTEDVLRPDDLALLTRVRSELDEIRERDVRELSQLLYPAGVNLGVAHAVRLLVKRVPSTIATEIVIDERLGSTGTPDQLDIERRVALVRTAEEGITNALRHGRAGHIWLELAVEDIAGDRVAVRLSVDTTVAVSAMATPAGTAWRGRRNGRRASGGPSVSAPRNVAGHG